MNTSSNVFSGCIPALMTPCSEYGEPDFNALAAKGSELIDAGMRAVVYCGSMGDWPLLSDKQRQQGVEALVNAKVPVIVGTGAQNTVLAAEHAAHARRVGAQGLMVIPRVLSRGISKTAQANHFSDVLDASDGLPSVIYNSPYYGYETQADLFFELREKFPNLVGFKEFGGADSMTYAAENITSGDDQIILMVGVDTQVVHGFLNCDAGGAITGVGNALPQEILCLVDLCERARLGDVQAGNLAIELNNALSVISTFDEGCDLVLFYKHLMVLEGNPEYQNHFNPSDKLSPSQKHHLESQWKQFRSWWANWSKEHAKTLNLKSS